MGEDAAATQKLKVSKIVEGDITCLRFIGTIDEDFDGKALAESVSGTLIMDLGEVRRISSFGIREWVDFITECAKKSPAIHYIECTPKVIDQFNMVANFGGPGSVLSFYAPYRCDYCDDDRDRLVQVDEAFELIEAQKLPDVPCQSCGNPEYFDEDPTFFTYLSGQKKVEPDAQVANFLASRLDYRVSDAARQLKVDKVVEEATYIRLAGDIDIAFPRDKLAEGLEGDVVLDVAGIGRIDDEGQAEWTAFMHQVSEQSTNLYLRDCPVGFVEKLFTPEALGDKAQVITFFMPFKCPACETSAAQRVRTADHFDVLKFATSPELECAECQTRAPSIASEEFLAQLHNLNEPQPTKGIETFIEHAQETLKPAADKGPTLAAPVIADIGGRRISLVAVAVAVIALAVVGVGIYLILSRLDKEKKIRYAEEGKVVGKSGPTPAWHKGWKNNRVRETPEGLEVIGYSHTVKLNKKGEGRALDDAIERIVDHVALSMPAPWKDAILKQYKRSRQEAFDALSKAMSDKNGPAAERAKDRLWAARAAVHKALRETGWEAISGGENYNETLQTNDGKRWRFWLLLKVPKAKLARLAARYKESVESQGVTVTNYFPGLAWKYPSHSAGAVVLSLTEQSKWRLPGLTPGHVVVNCDKRNITAAKEFKEIVEKVAKTFKLTGGFLRCQTMKRGKSGEVGYQIAKVEKPKPRPMYYPMGMGMSGMDDVPVWDDPTK